jgi:hypothetical protein
MAMAERHQTGIDRYGIPLCHRVIGSIPNTAGDYDLFTVPTGKRAVILTSKVYLAAAAKFVIV